jgi:GT2 family glycosyltransferase
VPRASSQTAAVVVGTNERRWLEECVGSLSEGRGVGDPLLIYVDNASSDGSAEWVSARFPEVTVLRLRSNRGFAHANNEGIKEALRQGAAYAYLANPDTRTPRHLLQALTEFMDEHASYGVVGPMQTEYRPDQDVDQPSPLNEWSQLALQNGERNVFHDDAPAHPSTAGPATGRAERTLEHAYVQGAALFARLEAVRRAGCLDPLYHTYYEETDLCRRVRWCGYRVALLLDATTQHRGGGSGPASAYRTYHMLRNRYVFALTDPTWTRTEVTRLSLLWSTRILRDAFSRDPGAQPALTPLLAGRIAAWFALHWPQVLTRRRRNARLLNGGSSPGS